MPHSVLCTLLCVKLEREQIMLPVASYLKLLFTWCTKSRRMICACFIVRFVLSAVHCAAEWIASCCGSSKNKTTTCWQKWRKSGWTWSILGKPLMTCVAVVAESFLFVLSVQDRKCGQSPHPIQTNMIVERWTVHIPLKLPLLICNSFCTCFDDDSSENSILSWIMFDSWQVQQMCKGCM